MFNKKILNKIGILINWPRELDIYANLINLLKKKNNYELVLNDLKTFNLQRKNNLNILIKSCNQKKIKYVFFSKVYKQYKYKILFSTGLPFSEKITFLSFLKYIYAKAIGYFFEYIKVDKILMKIFNRSFTGGGKNAKIYYDWFPEKKIGKIVVFFPRGMDLSLNYFPNPKFKKLFDIFLCHGNYDKKLIENKFKNKNNLIIGYPRYDEKLNFYKTKKKIQTEFSLNKKKKTILWIPGFIEEKNEVSKNIEIWINQISKLTKKYNIILRPHPKNLNYDPKLKKILLNHNFFIDKKQDRKLLELYIASDLILNDYGGSVLTTLYLKKKFATLEFSKKFKLRYIQKLIAVKSLDYEIRKKLNKKIIIKDDDKFFNKKIEYLIRTKYDKKLEKLRGKLFNNFEKKVSLKELIKKFQKLLNV